MSGSPLPPPRAGLGARLRARLRTRLYRWAIAGDAREGPHYTTIHHRPKRADAVGTWSEPAIALPKVAVAMQGPVMAEDGFTRETLALYARLHPGVRLILSTWAGTDPALLAPIAALGVEVVLSDPPAFAGMFNVNMQITSAAAGVRRAVEGGADWVLKTRTDQRLYAPNALAGLHALATAFPVAGGTAQRHRIVGVGQGSLKYAPYHVTDQTMFGHAEDMVRYWTPPLRAEDWPADWPRSAAEVFRTVPVGELCRRAAAESYLASTFLGSLGRPLDWTLADTWAAYRDHFCFADFAVGDFYWVKGQTYSQREFATRYDAISNREEMLFRDWFLLWTGRLDPAVAGRYQASAFGGRFNDPVRAA